mgnify:CR=1 FL=1
MNPIKKTSKNRKGFAISATVVVLIAVVTLAVTWYSGQTVADTIMTEAKDVVMGLMGTKKMVIRDKETFIGLLKCYTSLKMQGHGMEIEKVSFPNLEGTKWEGCVAMGSGPKKIEFELDLGKKEFIELGNENDCKGCDNGKEKFGRLYVDSYDKEMHIFGPDGRENTGPDKWWTPQASNKYSFCAPVELAVANGHTVETSEDTYNFCSTPGAGVHRNTVRLYDGAKGKITGYYKCTTFKVVEFFPDALSHCHGTFKVIIEEKGEDYDVVDDAFIEKITGLPDGRVRDIEIKE